MKKVNTDPKAVDEILERGTIVEILPSKDEFRKRMLSGDRLRFYIGFDATAPTLHLSHAKNFMLMEKLRKLGHEVIILFGDFTARIGDPSGESSARKQLSHDEVMNNVKQWKKLVRPLMDFKDRKNPPKIKYNHRWLSKLSFEEIISLASNFTVQQMIERDMFQKRLKEEKPIHLHEFLYPLMQGYDSVAMDVDAEMCGTDQIFNALAGRTLLKKLKGKDKFVIAVTLMENPKTGELMSKSKGTGVFLHVSPEDMYGQIMAQPDEMIPILFTHNTNLSKEEIQKIINEKNPRDAKMHLAREITKIFHGEKVAERAEKHFVSVIQNKEIPDEIETHFTEKEKMSAVDILVETKLAESKSEAKRLLAQEGVKINGDTAKEDKEYTIAEGLTVQKGKRYFVKIVKRK